MSVEVLVDGMVCVMLEVKYRELLGTGCHIELVAYIIEEVL